MEAKDIEFTNFSKSVTTEEFVGVLELMKAINENFEKALSNRENIAKDSLKNLEKLEKEKGKYSQALIDARRIHKGLESVTNEDISKDFSTFLLNYEGIIEFLTRFTISGSIKKHDITPFLIKKTK